MNSQDYRNDISRIIRNTLSRRFPGLKKDVLISAAKEAGIAIHAKFYGANVDGVESPIWRDDKRWEEEFKNNQPTKTATELLNE